VPAPHLVRARNKRTHRPILGNYFLSALLKLFTFGAERLAASTGHAMFGFDALPVRAIFVIVMHVSVCGRVFFGVCVICRHCPSLLYVVSFVSLIANARAQCQQNVDKR
jgi:hypothetical protein